MMRRLIAVVGLKLLALLTCLAALASPVAGFAEEPPAKNAGQETPPSPTVEKLLQKKVTISLPEGSTLEQAMKQALGPIGLQWHFDLGPLKAVEVQPDSVVELAIKDISTEMALDLILKRINPEMVWVERERVIIISTLKEQVNFLEVKVYEVEDLLRYDAPPDEEELDYERLEDTLI